MTHTPTPWYIDQTCIEHHCCHSSAIMADDGEDRLLVSEVCTDQDASHIVKCVNAHDDLVSALQLVTISAAWHSLTENTRVIISTALAKAGAA